MRHNISIFLFFFFFSCGENYTPKPRAFFKVNLPSKEYATIDIDCPFQFDIPILYGNIESPYSIIQKMNFPANLISEHVWAEMAKDFKFKSTLCGRWFYEQGVQIAKFQDQTYEEWSFPKFQITMSSSSCFKQRSFKEKSNHA